MTYKAEELGPTKRLDEDVKRGTLKGNITDIGKLGEEE